ncbi:MAG: hypothetical protein ACRDJB_07960 [Actinomycetota bacterium]
MNQSRVSAHDPIIVSAATIGLIEGAARDLKDLNEEVLTPETADEILASVARFCHRISTLGH